MQDRIDHMNGHYVLCGIGRVGSNVAHELAATDRPLVAIDESTDAIAAFRERFPTSSAAWRRLDDRLLAKAAPPVRRATSRSPATTARTADHLSAKQVNPRRASSRAATRCATSTS